MFVILQLKTTTTKNAKFTIATFTILLMTLQVKQVNANISVGNGNQQQDIENTQLKHNNNDNDNIDNGVADYVAEQGTNGNNVGKSVDVSFAAGDDISTASLSAGLKAPPAQLMDSISSMPLSSSQSNSRNNRQNDKLPSQLSSRIIHTRNGAISGLIVQLDARHLDAVEAYRGIPYASPPVGNLRFMPPVSAAMWPGVKKAERYFKF